MLPTRLACSLLSPLLFPIHCTFQETSSWPFPLLAKCVLDPTKKDQHFSISILCHGPRHGLGFRTPFLKWPPHCFVRALADSHELHEETKPFPSVLTQPSTKLTQKIRNPKTHCTTPMFPCTVTTRSTQLSHLGGFSPTAHTVSGLFTLRFKPCRAVDLSWSLTHFPSASSWSPSGLCRTATSYSYFS